jgi:translation initiation factor IF-3
VRVIGPDGSQLGIKSLPEALSLSRELELDLVEVAPLANPPVCRIMDYGKFKYEEAQKAKDSRRKSVSSQIKEMKYRPKIGGGDFDTKTRKVHEFLAEGHKVKITIMFRGREMQHPELGMKILHHVADVCVDVSKIEAAPKQDGRNMIMVLAPDRKKAAAPPPKPSAPSSSPAKTGGEAPSTPSSAVSAAVDEVSTPTPAAESPVQQETTSAPEPSVEPTA